MKRNLALLIGLLALLGGGTAVALGAAGPHAHHGQGRPHGTIAVAAGYLGVSSQQLHRELREGSSLGEIADQTAGHSEAGLVAALLAARKGRLAASEAQLPARVEALVKRKGLGRVLARRAHAARRAVLAYLGLDLKQLRTELHGGKTLAQIADATAGKSADGLVQVIVGARGASIAQAVQSGALSKKAAANCTAKLQKRVRARINRVHLHSGARAPAR